MALLMTNAELAQAIDQAIRIMHMPDTCAEPWAPISAHLQSLLAVQRARAEASGGHIDKTKYDKASDISEKTGCGHAITGKVWRGNGIDSDTICIRCGDKVGQTRVISDPPPLGGKRCVPKATKFD